jgi:xylose isomerase
MKDNFDIHSWNLKRYLNEAEEVDSKIKEDFTTFNNEFNSIIASQNTIIDELIKFVEKQENTIFSEVDKSTLIENLNN